jgi:triacylglycerol lipase
MTKPPPVYDIQFVLHPEQDAGYVHFENAAAHPFEPAPGSLSRVNAWWLAEAALLSYWDPPQALAIFESAGLDAEFVEERNTECYVAWNAGAVIVAFRGTESDEWPDVLTDAEVPQIPWQAGRGSVHEGFARAVQEIWPKLTARLDKRRGNRTVWFCGHSLGAALATLAADKFDDARGVCTFGSPRVGDPAFAREFTTRFVNRCARYVNDHDVVTHVPPPLLIPWSYRHVDPRRFIDPAGQISDGDPDVPHFFADLIGSPRALLDIVNALGVIEHAPMFLLDHMPKAYAIWTWNDYEAHAG